VADVVADIEDEDVDRRPGEPLYGPRSGTPEPSEPPAPEAAPEPAREPVPAYGSPDAGAADAAAYVVKADARTAVTPTLFAVIGAGLAGYALYVGLGVLALVGLAFAIPLLLHVRDMRRGVVYFSVDADGVYLGEAAGDDGSASLETRTPWESIGTVTVFEIEEVSRDSDGDRTTRWRKAVGLTLRGDGPGGPRGVAHYQVFRNYGLDRRELEAAVARFGRGTPVVDGPALGSASLGDVAGAVLDFLRRPQS
jgi:hypothetical protein